MSKGLPQGLLKTMREKVPLIITHWDADGVITASLLLSWLNSPEEAKVVVPPFTFSWDRDFLDIIERESKERGYLAVLDLAVPGGTLDLVWARVKKTMVVVDHHVQSELPRRPAIVYINPARKGDPGGRWPSAAHVLSSILGYWKDPLLLAASIVGDLGPEARASLVYQDYMAKAGLHPVNDFWIAEDCANLIDAASIMGRRDVLEVLPKRLSFEENPCEIILKDGLLHSLRAKAEGELEELLSGAKPELVTDDILVFVMKGEGRHASKLARRLAKKYKDKIVIVIYKSLGTGKLRGYARSYSPHAPPLVMAAERLRSLGYPAGGKYQTGNNVVALEAPRGVSEEKVLEDLLNSLKVLGVRI